MILFWQHSLVTSILMSHSLVIGIIIWKDNLLLFLYIAVGIIIGKGKKRLQNYLRPWPAFLNLVSDIFLSKNFLRASIVAAFISF